MLVVGDLDQPRPQAALLAPMAQPDAAIAHALLVADDRSRVFEADEIEAAGALADAARSSMAQHQLAEQTGMTLVGFLRGDTMNVYTHVHRVTLPAPDRAATISPSAA